MLWSEGASRPGGADSRFRPWPWRLPLGERAMSGKDIPSALGCTADGTTVSQRGSREYDGWQVKPPELRARKPSSNGSKRCIDAGARTPLRVQKRKNNMWMTRGKSSFLQTYNSSRSEQNCTVGKPTAPSENGIKECRVHRCISHHLLKNKQLTEQITHRPGHLTEDPARPVVS